MLWIHPDSTPKFRQRGHFRAHLQRCRTDSPCSNASPIATAVARAKHAETTEEDVLELAENILESRARVVVPRGESWDWAYDLETLRDICILREHLLHLRSDAAAILRAVCLGALRGPLSKDPVRRSYFSNQMPRTFASKPDYSVRFWKQRARRPVNVDVLTVIERRVERLQLRTLPSCRSNSRLGRRCAASQGLFAYTVKH